MEGRGPCSECHGQDHLEEVDPKSALPLIGFPNTGKTVYLCTLHDQLMHGNPEWGVEVSKRGRDELFYNYNALCRGRTPNATPPGFCTPFRMRVRWGRWNRFDLVMWDLAGEHYSNYGSDRFLDPYGEFLAQSRVLLVCLNFSYTGEAADTDMSMRKFFERLLLQNRKLKKVVVLLVGADCYGASPQESYPLMMQEYESRFRQFSGILKNAGVRVEGVPLTNFGFGNDLQDRSRTPKYPPAPHNVLEPLRRALPVLTSPWRRFLLPARSERSPQHASDCPSEVPEKLRQTRATPRKVYLSYPRSAGDEIARRIRKALQEHDWDAFLDVEDLGSKEFNDRLLLEMQNSHRVLALLYRGRKVTQTKDPFRRELIYAVSENRPVIQVSVDRTVLPPGDALPSELAPLRRCPRAEYSSSAPDEGIENILAELSIIRWHCASCGARLRAELAQEGNRRPQLPNLKVKRADRHAAASSVYRWPLQLARK